MLLVAEFLTQWECDDCCRVSCSDVKDIRIIYTYTNPYTRSSTTYPNTQFYHNYIQHWIKIKLPWSCWRKFCLDKIWFTRQNAHINCSTDNIYNMKKKRCVLIRLFTCDRFHHPCPHNTHSSADWGSTWWSDPLRTGEETGTPPRAPCPLSKMKISTVNLRVLLYLLLLNIQIIK